MTREELAGLHRALAEAQEKTVWVDRIGADTLERVFGSRTGDAALRVARRARQVVRARRAPKEPAPLTGPADGPKPTRTVRGWRASAYTGVLELAREGVVPTEPGAGDGPLHLALVVPSFGRGSGGHSTLFNLFTRLEERGHSVTYWVHDFTHQHSGQTPAQLRAQVRDWFRPPAGPVFSGFGDWHGADVAIATGWQTVHPVLRLPATRARAYVVQDVEPEFYATSAERLWSEETYAAGLQTIAASPWLARRVGAAHHFDLGIDHSLYAPRPAQRRDDTVIFYARDVTPRRAVPLGMLALEELERRRPGVRCVLFGQDKEIATPFDYEHLGIATPAQLAWAYSEATVGLSLSLTNHSLIPQEMLACGLPCVELAGLSIEAEFGPDGPIALAAPDPIAIADALERLLSDPAERERRAAVGLAWARERTWERATDQVEAALLHALQA